MNPVRGCPFRLSVALCVVTACLPGIALAQESGAGTARAVTNGSDLTSLSSDQLINLQVTSVCKKPQRLSQAAAAITVITQDEYPAFRRDLHP